MSRAASLSALALVGVCACSPPEGAQTALTATARAVAELDAHMALIYEAAAHRALDESSTREEYDRAMAPFNALEEALRGARFALLASQEALNVWRDEGGSEASFAARLPALAGALRAVLDHLRDLDVEIPAALTDALGLVEALGGNNGG